MPTLIAATGPGCQFPGCDGPGEFPLILWVAIGLVALLWVALIVGLLRRN
jgi:hypothetical protein